MTFRTETNPLNEKKFLVKYPKSKFNENKGSARFANFISLGRYDEDPDDLVITYTDSGKFYIGQGWNEGNKTYNRFFAETEGTFLDENGEYDYDYSQVIIDIIKNENEHLHYTKYLDMLVEKFHDYINNKVIECLILLTV